MSPRLSLTVEEKALGERIKATKVAICEFLAEHPSTVTDPSSLRREAAAVEAYSISSRRHLLAMQSELEATIRELERQILRKYWSRSAFDALVVHLRDRRLIDISDWIDRDALRTKHLLQRGEIRTTSEYRLATEYRDTIADRDELAKLAEMLGSYEAKRGVPALSAEHGSMSGRSTASPLSAEDIAYADVLKRSAIESLSYAARYEHEDSLGESSLKERADAWRNLKVVTRRDLRDLERAFWVVLTKLRRYRLSQDQFEALAADLKQKDLMDVSRLSKKSHAQK